MLKAHLLPPCFRVFWKARIISVFLVSLCNLRLSRPEPCEKIISGSLQTGEIPICLPFLFLHDHFGFLAAASAGEFSGIDLRDGYGLMSELGLKFLEFHAAVQIEARADVPKVMSSDIIDAGHGFYMAANEL